MKESKEMACRSTCKLHIVMFPFMSKGHTIPLLDLCRLLLNLGAAVTIFTTQANRSFISQSLADPDVFIIYLPFPENIFGIPSGFESTDQFPSASASLYYSFASAAEQMQPHFKQALHTPPRVDSSISIKTRHPAAEF